MWKIHGGWGMNGSIHFTHIMRAEQQNVTQELGEGLKTVTE